MPAASVIRSLSVSTTTAAGRLSGGHCYDRSSPGERGCTVLVYYQQDTAQKSFNSWVGRFRKEVREVFLSRKNFMANMSHELGLYERHLGFTHLLKLRTGIPDWRNLVESIRKSGENLSDYYWWHPQSFKNRRQVWCELNQHFQCKGLLQFHSTMFCRKMSEKGLQFSTAIDGSIPDTLSGDATRWPDTGKYDWNCR